MRTQPRRFWQISQIICLVALAGCGGETYVNCPPSSLLAELERFDSTSEVMDLALVDRLDAQSEVELTHFDDRVPVCEALSARWMAPSGILRLDLHAFSSSEDALGYVDQGLDFNRDPWLRTGGFWVYDYGGNQLQVMAIDECVVALYWPRDPSGPSSSHTLALEAVEFVADEICPENGP